MGDVNAAELLRQSDKMFGKKFQLDMLYQRLAEEFYPERADFTRTRVEGEEFAENLFESTPAQNRRELAYAMGSLMRPPAKKWFKQVPKEIDLRSNDRANAWCAFSSETMRQIIYSGRSGWQRALPEGDNDVIAFGNAVHSMAEGPDRDGVLIYDTHHIRDCAWSEDRYRVVNRLDRKFPLALRNWEKQFPEKPLSVKWAEVRKKSPEHEIQIRHVVLPVEEYDSYKSKKRSAKQKFASVYLDVECQEVIREAFFYQFPYYVRRWLLRTGSPYGYSPAAMLGLVDARVLQAQSRVILDAGELAVRPPVLARDEVLGDASLYAGAINWVSPEYDERNGEAIRTLDMGGNLQIGLEMKVDTRQILAAAFYLNKLTLPSDKEMTAYEVSERLTEYIRSIGPVVEPFEADNTALLDMTFSMGLRLGRFGPLQSIPEELQGQDLSYEFDTPIQIAYARQKKARAEESITYAANMATALQDPSVFDHLNRDKLLRDGVLAIDGEQDWLRPMEEVAAKRQADAQAMQAQALQQQVSDGIDMAGRAGEALPKAMALGGMLAGAGGGQQAAEEDWPDLGPDEEQAVPATSQGMGQAGTRQPSALSQMFAGAEDAPTVDMAGSGGGEPMDGGPLTAAEPMDEADEGPVPSRGTGRGTAPQRNLPAVRTDKKPASEDEADKAELKDMLRDLIGAIGAEQQVVRDKNGKVTGIKRVKSGRAVPDGDVKAMLGRLLPIINADQEVVRDASGKVTGIKRNTKD